ncbi:MAG: hypothetical protein AAB134_01820 [Pseudomonadota bacterium]
MHQQGGCVNTGGSIVEDCKDYSGYRTSNESQCYSTGCPECGDEVFFIKHNGGSVWIDPPLGPPWYKHSCFEEKKLITEKNNLLIGSSAAVVQVNENSILGIVKSAEVSYSKESTVLIFETGKKEQHILLMRNNAGYLVGKLALYRQHERTVTVFYEAKYPFAVVTEIHGGSNESAKNEKVICPELDCGKELTNNICSHLIDVHWYDERIFDLHPTSG